MVLDLFGLLPYQHQIGQVAVHPDVGVTGICVPLVGEQAYSSQTYFPTPTAAVVGGWGNSGLLAILDVCI